MKREWLIICYLVFLGLIVDGLALKCKVCGYLSTRPNVDCSNPEERTCDSPLTEAHAKLDALRTDEHANKLLELHFKGELDENGERHLKYLMSLREEVNKQSGNFSSVCVLVKFNETVKMRDCAPAHNHAVAITDTLRCMDVPSRNPGKAEGCLCNGDLCNDGNSGHNLLSCFRWELIVAVAIFNFYFNPSE